MKSTKLLLALIALMLVLAGVLYYLFTNSKPKRISFHGQETRTEQNANKQNPNTQTPPSEKVANASEQIVDTIKAKKDSQSQNTDSNARKSVRKDPSKDARNFNYDAPQSSSGLYFTELYGELSGILAEGKREKTLGSKKYKVYLDKELSLNADEKALLGGVISMLERRGWYYDYVIFVKKRNPNAFELVVFNQDLVQTQRFAPRKMMPAMLFKFNKFSIYAVKNSFHIGNLRASVGDLPFKSITFSGHTDEKGSTRYNYDLSLLRAASIASEFVRYTARMQLIAYGKEAPVSDKHRYQNRRVETEFE